jgi:CBS domain containing-hemolysin-like protein
MTGWFMLAALGLLAANAFFVAVEFALLASRVTRLEPMAEDGTDRRAALALESIRDLQPQLAGAQLGITMSSLGLGYFAEPTLERLLDGAIGGAFNLPSGVTHTLAFLLSFAFVVVIHMVIGEMVPKNIAIAMPERSARLLAPAHNAYVTVFRPVVWFLTWLSNGITRLLGMEPADELNTALTVNEFHRVIEGAVEEGKLEAEEHELLVGALDFRARTAGSIMVPRRRLVTVPRSTSVADIEALVARVGHSRIPVTGTNPDDVVGFVHSKDLLRFGAGERGDPVPLEMVRRMLIVTPDQSVRDLMRSMRRLRRHMALVRTGDGQLLGMVTLEDVLEALVGDITDETDGGSRAAALDA